jgi:hypothetical protein
MFWNRKGKNSESYRLLTDILSSPNGRESMLGVQRASRPTQEQLMADVSRMVQHTRTEDYKVWAQRVWVEVLAFQDKILDPRTTPDNLQFYRGAYAASLKLLRLSYEAVGIQERLKKETQLSPTPKAH